MSTRKSSKQKRIDELENYVLNLQQELQDEKSNSKKLNEDIRFYDARIKDLLNEKQKIDLQLATVRIEYANMHQLRVNEADYNSRQLNVMGNLSMAMNKILDKFGGEQ